MVLTVQLSGTAACSPAASDEAEGQKAGKGREQGGEDEFFGYKQFLHKSKLLS